MDAELHAHGASKAVYANPPDWPEMVVWQRRLRPGDLFLDVGANVGTYSLWAADLGAQVIAVEPGSAVGRLRHNVALNDLPIEVVEAAAMDKAGVVMLDESASDTLSHVSTLGRSVVAVTIDSILDGRAAAGMKVDVEGAERLVLEGAREALAGQRIGCIQLEWNSYSRILLGEPRSKAAQILNDHGYRLHRALDDGTLVPDDGEEGNDVFALPV